MRQDIGDALVSSEEQAKQIQWTIDTAGITYDQITHFEAAADPFRSIIRHSIDEN